MDEDTSILGALEDTNQMTLDENNNNTVTIVKELLDKKNLKFISELTSEQVNEIVKLKAVARMFSKDNFPTLSKIYPVEDTINHLIDDFMMGMISHNRKRVGEFLDGILGERKNIENKPDLIDRMKNVFRPQ